jgi:hypothetical protein
VRVPFGAGDAEVEVVKAPVGFWGRPKIRVKNGDVPFEVDEDVAELVRRPTSE